MVAKPGEAMPTVAEDNVTIISKSHVGHPYRVSFGNPFAEFLIPRWRTVSRSDSIFPNVIGSVVPPGGVQLYNADPDDRIWIHRNPFDDAGFRHL